METQIKGWSTVETSTESNATETNATDTRVRLTPSERLRIAREAATLASIEGYADGVREATNEEKARKASFRQAISDERAIRESALGLTAAYAAATAAKRARTGDPKARLDRAEKATVRANVLAVMAESLRATADAE